MSNARPADVSVANELRNEVTDFISRHIASVEELEVLLLLHDHSNRDWSVAEINARLRSQDASIRQWLEVLIAMGLVAAIGQGDRFRFAPKTPENAHAVGALADAYRERRIKVIELIFSKPNQTLRSFVQAFDFRQRP